MTLPGQVGSGEQIPSKVVSNYLFGSETFRGEWRKHPIFLWKQILAAALSPFVVGYLGGVLSNAEPIILRVILLLWVLLLLWVMWGIADWYYDRFVLTNKRIMEVSGIVTRKVAMMPLGRVTDMAYNQSVLGRMLNYGTFIVESAGQDQALREISTLPRPNALYLLMCDEMYGSPEAAPPKRTRTRKKESSGTPGPWRAD
jgi:membrane protein YdbS with pleckstrin-like domain